MSSPFAKFSNNQYVFLSFQLRIDNGNARVYNIFVKTQRRPIVMKFYMPTRLYSENNCIEKHSAELASLGTHALIITGRSSSKCNGSLNDVISALEKHSVKYTVFDSVIPPL